MSVYPEKNGRMLKYHDTGISVHHRSLIDSLPGLLLAWSLQLVRKILSFLISAFLAFIFGERKAAKSHVPQQQIQELQQATDLEDRFLTMASHELKTPMTTISGNAQLMLRRLSRMPELSSEMLAMRTALESIDAQSRRLSTLVDDLLDLSSLRSGRIKLRLALCDLGDLCREVVENQRLLTNRTIEFTLPQSSVMVLADCDRLLQVIVNLVVNALKYSPEESLVKVRVNHYSDLAYISVSDSGPGIPEDQQNLIFEPFYRGSSLQASPKHGLGLGLTICKEIIELHGGQIRCESVMGKGAIFFVQLPLPGHTAGEQLI